MSMKREEAIKIFEDWAQCNYAPTKEAAQMALTAIRPISREQVEKVWRGEWVERHKHRGGFRRVTGMDDMGEQHEVTIDERCEYDDLYCSKCGKQSPDNFLNFCGYCGAPMTDEAVHLKLHLCRPLTLCLWSDAGSASIIKTLVLIIGLWIVHIEMD